MADTNPNPYLKTKVLTASPEELRLMLFDGAIRFAEKARAGLEKKDYEAVYEGVTRCQNILMELMNALRPDQDPELCNRLSGLYTFMFTELMMASHERDVKRVENVIRLLQYERETWQMVIDKLREENRHASDQSTAAVPAGASPAPAAPNTATATIPAAARPANGQRPAIKGSLIGGTLSLKG